MTLDGFRDVTETPISLDFSNSWIADIRLNAGDRDGRTITVAITDNGQPITSTTGITSVALAYNTAPGVEVGDRVPMTPVSGQATATYRATLPRRAIAKPGVIALGVEVTTADGAKICSRNFKGVVERAVWDAESTQGQDSLTRLEQLIADGGAAITRVNNAITDANNAVAAANQVIADARITGGNTTTLDPNQPATSSLRGSGLQRILDLSIPRGAGVTSAGATTLDPNKPATASMLQAGSKGDYTLMVGVPRGSRIIGVGANTVNPSREAGASMSTDGAGDRSLILDIPRGERIAGVTARTLDAGISAIAAGLWHQLKNLRSQIADEETRRAEHEQLMADMRRGCEHEKLVDEALRTLLLCKLEQQQDTMVHDHHGVADNDFKLRAQRVYDAYHGLGGNGHGTQVNNDIQNAPIAPRLGGKPS